MTFFCIEARADFYAEEVRPLWQRTFDSTASALWLTGLAGVAVIEPQDDFIRGQWRDHQKISKSNADVGDFLGSGIPGAAIAIGQLYWDTPHGVDHARTLIYSTLWTSSLKAIFSRPRPGGSQNRQSFPSGHSSAAFASATVLSLAYGWKTAVIAYPLATFVAFSRLADDVHWGSDVYAGAVLGMICARAAHFESLQSNETSFYPWYDKGVSGLGLAYRF